MTDADYELWAAMMADEEEAAKPTSSISVAPAVETQPEPVTDTPKFFPLKPVVAEPIPVVLPTVEELEAADEFEQEDEEDLEFPSAFFKEPQTNSITVPEVPDALSADIVTDSGEILKTGAIDMPILNNTGSIPIITVTPEEADEEAIIADMGDETTGGIPPIRSGSVMNSSARVGVLPIKNRRSEGQTIILATTSILLVALGAGLIAAYMFKLI